MRGQSLTPVMVITALLLLASAGYCQEQARPDGWRGLVLNESSPEEAIQVLGAPSADTTDKLLAYRIQSWLTRRAKEKVFRRLDFKKPEGIDKARLFFLDNKLVAIDLDLKKGVSPQGLSGIYGIEFQPMVSGTDIAFNSRDYERNQGRVYPKTYPTVYAMVAASPESFITAMVSNVPSFGGAFAKSMGIPDQPGTLPGKVETVMLISRTLENKDGLDVLK